MANLITIEQLLESVDLDFEPRWVTKNAYGLVVVWAEKPQPVEGYWCGGSDIAMKRSKFGTLKLAEFYGKDWTECIYEIKKKETIVCVREREWINKPCWFWNKSRDSKVFGALAHIEDHGAYPYLNKMDNKYYLCCELIEMQASGKIERFTLDDFATVVDVGNCVRSVLDSRAFDKLNKLVDAVNELKERTEPITLNPDLTDEDLRKIMRDPKYWRDRNSALIQKVQDGLNKLYGDKN